MISVCETGFDVMKLVDDPAIVIANHQSTADIPTMMYALQAKKNAIKDIMWIQDMILRYLDFGWVSLVHGDFFIEQVNFTHTFCTGIKRYDRW